MPTLPTLTVTQAQADRMLAAFGSTEFYLAWLKNEIIDFVVAKESAGRSQSFAEQERLRVEQAKTELAT